MAYISENTTKKKKELEDYEANKPGAYQSQYGDTINSLLDQVVNRKPFSYDFNADPLYQQYKDNYIQQGNQAMMNTMANAATLTGGYGNSYATSAGAQVNQQYLTQLNNIIPELYSAAMDKYNMDTDRLMNQYSTLADADSRDYSRYQDTLANYNANRDYLYGQYIDAVGMDQYQEQFDYTKSQDAQAYQQWLEQFNYTKQQDAQAYQQWLEQFNYTKSQDAQAYQQWLEQFNYTKQQDALDRAAAELATKKTSSGSGGSVEQATVKSSSENSLVNTAVEANKIAKNSNDEEAAEYLAEQVNNGVITEEQAVNIYNNIVPEETKKGTGGTSVKLNNKSQLNNVSLK